MNINTDIKTDIETESHSHLTISRLYDMVQPHFNDLCIMYQESIVRLIGVAEEEDDFYYVTKNLKGVVAYYSAVGSYISLKSYIPEQDYTLMDDTYECNGCTKANEMVYNELDVCPGSTGD